MEWSIELSWSWWCDRDHKSMILNFSVCGSPCGRFSKLIKSNDSDSVMIIFTNLKLFKGFIIQWPIQQQIWSQPIRNRKIGKPLPYLYSKHHWSILVFQLALFHSKSTSTRRNLSVFGGPESGEPWSNINEYLKWILIWSASWFWIWSDVGPIVWLAIIFQPIRLLLFTCCRWQTFIFESHFL